MTKHSFENPMQQMPEHYGIALGVATSVSKACDVFLRSRGYQKMGMREMIGKAAEKGKRKKKDIG